MALSKTFTQTMQYQNNSLSPVTVSIVCKPDVSGSNLVAGRHVVRPGVFSAGTPAEGTAANPQNDSNS